MLSVGLSIKLIGFLVIAESLYGCFSRCNFLFPCRKKRETHQPIINQQHIHLETKDGKESRGNVFLSAYLVA